MNTQQQIDRLREEVESLKRSHAELEERLANLEEGSAPNPVGRPAGAALQRIHDAIEVIRVWNQCVFSDSTFAVTQSLLKLLRCEQKVLAQYIKSDAARAEIQEIHAESGIPEPVPGTFNRGKDIETLKALVNQWYEVDKPVERRDRHEKLKELVLQALKHSG